MFGALGKVAAIAALAIPGLIASPGTGSAVINNPPPDKVVVDLVTVIGSGCPEGTAAVAVSPDNTAFTVTYSNYLAQVGVGAKPIDFRKNCQLNILVHVPTGFTYAISDVVYRGFSALEKGASAIERANYYFQGSPVSTYSQHSFTGPLQDNWQAVDQVDMPSMVYAPCGELRNLNINTELRVNAGTSDVKNTTSFFTMDSTDGAVSTLYHFAWKQCPAATPTPSPSKTK
jgi:hypothetical protein